VTALTPRVEFLAGVRAQLPILLGTTPLGMIYGVLAAGAGLPAPAAIGMSSVVFAGSAQFIAAGLFAEQAPTLVIVLTTLVVNLRHALYSASLAPYVQHLSLPWKLLISQQLTDEAYAVAITRYRQIEPEAARGTNLHWFYLGGGLALFVSWQVSTAVGVLLGAQIPAAWSLDFTLALTFIALLVPTLTARPALAAALAAGVAALIGHALPFKLGLVAAVLLGIGVGLGAEALAARRSSGAAA
jgi:4-azaleucine resistance transporter AzlC